MTNEIRWRFLPGQGEIVKESNGKKRLRVEMEGSCATVALHRFKAESTKIPNETLWNRILHCFGYGWVVLRIKLPQGEKFVKVNFSSFKKSIKSFDPFIREKFLSLIVKRGRNVNIALTRQDTVIAKPALSKEEDKTSQENPALKEKKLALEKLKEVQIKAEKQEAEKLKAKQAKEKKLRDQTPFLEGFAGITQGNLEDICQFLAKKSSLASPFEFSIGEKKLCAWCDNIWSFSIQAYEKKHGGEDGSKQELVSVNWKSKTVKIDGNPVSALESAERKQWIEELFKYTPAGIYNEALKEIPNEAKFILNLKENEPIESATIKELLGVMRYYYGKYDTRLLLDDDPDLGCWYDVTKEMLILQQGPNKKISISMDLDLKPVFKAQEIVWSDVGCEQEAPWVDLSKVEQDLLKEKLKKIIHLSQEAILQRVQDIVSVKKAEDELNPLQLSLLKAYYLSQTTPTERLIDGSPYKLSLTTLPGNPGHVQFKIQEYVNAGMPNMGELKLVIDAECTIVSVVIDGVKVSDTAKKVPERMLKPLKEFYKVAISKTSEYIDFQEERGTIKVHVALQGVRDYPEFHLRKVIDLLSEYDNWSGLDRYPMTRVNFKNSDLTLGPGSDAGGLSRTYLNELFAGLVKQSSLRFTEADDGLYIPHCRQNYNEEKPTQIPKLSKEEAELYRRMGDLMMRCYWSPEDIRYHRLTGEYLHKSVFAAFSVLDPKEVGAHVGLHSVRSKPKTHIDDWKDVTKLKVIKALAEAQEQFTHVIEISHRGLSEIKTKEDGLKILQELDNIDELPDAFKDENGVFDQSLVGIDDVKNELWKILYAAFGTQLAPIQALALGMFECLTLDGLNEGIAAMPAAKKTPEYLQKKIQGVLDRKRIINALQYDGQNARVKEKIQWLKTWLGKEETPISDIRAFLSYVTGSPSLSLEGKIKLSSGPHKVFPIAHTCFNELEMNEVDLEGFDDTEENFLRSLQACIQVEADSIKKGKTGYSYS